MVAQRASTNTDEKLPPRTRLGRQPSISHAELSRIALELFSEYGFESTTVDAVALAAGIGRRTLFRYFPSKNDLPWGDFDSGLKQMRDFLSSSPAEVPLVKALTAAVIEFNKFPAEVLTLHRERMHLLLNVPALAAHSTLRYAAWRQVVAEFASERLGMPVDSIAPQTIGRVFLGASLAAYEQWLKHEDADLVSLLTSAFAELEEVFAGDSTKQPAGSVASGHHSTGLVTIE